MTEIFSILLKLNHIAGMWLVSKCKKLLAVALASNNIPPNNNKKKKRTLRHTRSLCPALVVLQSEKQRIYEKENPETDSREKKSGRRVQPGAH